MSILDEDTGPPPIQFDDQPGGSAGSATRPGAPDPDGLYEVTDGHKDGKRRVKNPDGGFPIVMLDGETPAQAVDRFRAKRAENIAAGGGKKEKARQRKQAAREKAGKTGPGSIEDKLPPPKDRPAGDPMPKVQAPSAASVASKVSDQQLREAWQEICTLPGVYFGMPVHDHALDHPVPLKPGDPNSPTRIMPGFRPRCEYCRDHFFTTGAPMADELLKMGEANPAVKRWLTRGYHAYAAISGGTVVAMYLGKPLMHHLGPEQVTNQIAAMAGPFMAVKTESGQVLHGQMPPRPRNARMRPPGRGNSRLKRRPRPPRGAPSAAATEPAGEAGGTAQTI
jgi:hypothetical protein